MSAFTAVAVAGDSGGSASSDDASAGTGSARCLVALQRVAAADAKSADVDPMKVALRTSGVAAEETVHPPTWWRTALAVAASSVSDDLAAYVSYHVSNLATELQAEGHTDAPAAAAAAAAGGAAAVATTAFTEALAAVTRHAGARQAGTFASAKDAVRAAKRALGGERLLSACVGPGGESILHWALLLEVWDVAQWLFELEPMLFATVYASAVYKGEGVLHILASKKIAGLHVLRKLARRVLFYDAPPPAGEHHGWAPGTDCATLDGADEALREASWARLERYAHADVAAACKVAGKRAWRTWWLRQKWAERVNGLATGSFFKPRKHGGSCYYGGSPVSIATALGCVDTIRFLALEAGVTCVNCWDEGSRAAAEAAAAAARDDGGAPAAAGAFFYADFPHAAAGAASSVAALEAFDVSVCARLDLPDEFGNTAAHIAVETHDDAHMFLFLNALYTAGVGRLQAADICAAGDAAVKLQEAKKANRKAPHATWELAQARQSAAAATPSKPDSSNLITVTQLAAPLENAIAAALAGAPALCSGNALPEPAAPLAAAVRARLVTVLADVRAEGIAKKLNAAWLESAEGARAGGDFDAASIDVRFAAADAAAFACNAAAASADGKRKAQLRPVELRLRCEAAADTLARDRAALDELIGALVAVAFSDATPLLSEGALCAVAVVYHEGLPTPGHAHGAAHGGEKAPVPPSAVFPTTTLRVCPGADGCAATIFTRSAPAPPDASAAGCLYSTKAAAPAPPAKLLEIANKDGFTPLTLAASLGKREMFESIWRACQSIKEWEWGGVSCKTLELDQIDDIGQVIDQCDAATGSASPAARLACWAAESVSPDARLTRWASRVVRWWLPLPLELSAPVPPTVVTIMVARSVEELLDASSLGDGESGDAATMRLMRSVAASGLATAATLAEVEVAEHARLLAQNSTAPPPRAERRPLPEVYTEHVRDVERLLRLGSAGASGLPEVAPILALLVERKWERHAKVRFFKLFAVRVASVVAAFGLLVTRVALEDADPLAAACARALAAGAWAVFAVHFARHLRYGVFTSALRPREAHLYAAAHGKSFGRFYLATLGAGSLGLAVGASLDVAGGWSDAAGAIYAVGGFAATLHLLFFVLGFEGSGRLFVLMGSVIANEALRWLAIFLPVALAFAWFFFVIARGDTPDLASASAATPAAYAGSFFRDFFVGWALDSTLNPLSSYATNKTTATTSQAHAVLFMIFFLVMAFVCAICLLSLLIAQMSRVFEQYYKRTGDFLLERARACLIVDSLATADERLRRVAKRDRYWVLKAKEHDADQPLRPRPYFHWQVFASFPWANDEGKNLAKEARQPAHKRYNALAKSVAGGRRALTHALSAPGDGGRAHGSSRALPALSAASEDGSARSAAGGGRGAEPRQPAAAPLPAVHEREA